MIIDKLRIKDRFFTQYRKLVREEMIPYQWKVLNDAIDIKIEKERDEEFIPTEKSHAIQNFKIAAKLSKGDHYGWVFQDSDVYKWLEAVAYSLREQMDIELKKTADNVISLIGKAQEEDGYLDTYFTIMEPDRKFCCLSESHELYCAGHYFEAAVAYYETTKNEEALTIANKLAACIEHNFGAGQGKIHGCDGHEEIEIGLMKLYHLTGEQRYLDLSKYFLMIRGVDQNFFRKQKEQEKGKAPLIPGMAKWPDTYYQVHKPVLLQNTAEGHAVRLVYLCTAMADVAATNHDQAMYEACKRIWRNIVDRRMYITGGIGGTSQGESFTLDYDLPNDTMYCETCASVGLVFFARQMLCNEAKGEYGDVMERALYNTVLAGMALDGKHFFYVNPLEVVPEKSKKDPSKRHVKPVRPQWLGCSCCPPNIARLVTSIDDYIYVCYEDNRILVNLFVDSEAKFTISNGTMKIIQKTEYPWEGDISLQISCDAETEITLGIRIPNWADQYQIILNGEELAGDLVSGIIYITKKFQQDQILVHLGMEVKRWYTNPHVSENLGKVSISRGPIVYCAESIDNGEELHLLTIPRDAEFTYEYQEELLSGVGVIECEGWRHTLLEQDMPLYKEVPQYTQKVRQKIHLVPYYSWGNRGENEMVVWLREENPLASYQLTETSLV